MGWVFVDVPRLQDPSKKHNPLSHTQNLQPHPSVSSGIQRSRVDGVGFRARCFCFDFVGVVVNMRTYWFWDPGPELLTGLQSKGCTICRNKCKEIWGLQ